MKNLIVFFLLMNLSIVNDLTAGTKHDFGVRLSGRIEYGLGTPLNGNLHIYVQEDFHSANGQQTLLPKVCSINDGMFEIFIPTSHKSVYISFTILESGEVREKDLGINFNRFFLAKQTDDIFFSIQEDSVSIEGKGAAKWKCQYELYRYGGRNLQASIQAGREKDYKRKYDEIRLSNDAFIEKCINHLEAYKGMFSDEIYEQLYYDILGQAHMRVLQQLKFSFYRSDKEASEAKAFFTKYFKEKEQMAVNITPKLSSVYYCNYLLEKLYINRLSSSESLSIGRLPFRHVYQDIIDHYENPLVDKLIYLAFIRWGGEEDALKYWEDALLHIKSPEIKERMTAFLSIHETGGHVYSFSLPDTLGNFYTPEDFKGKMVLMDFWFTGCIPCKYLASALDSLMDDYHEREDIIFLSVNVDRNRVRWKDGLRSGDYTSSDQICVTTEGTHHPLIKAYQYDSFPKLLIFDRNGKIVSTNAPRPLDQKSINALKNMLN